MHRSSLHGDEPCPPAQATNYGADKSGEQSSQAACSRSLVPKGGGAIRGIGEKFGQSSYRHGKLIVPIATVLAATVRSATQCLTTRAPAMALWLGGA